MEFWFHFFLSLSYSLWFGLLMMLSGLYFVLVAPPLFRFWIVPKIEKRYKTSLTMYDPKYVSLILWPNWFQPPLQIPFYVLCRYAGWNKRIKRIYNVHPGSLIGILNKINYDIYRASKAEIVMSFISFCFFVCLIICSIVVALTM